MPCRNVTISNQVHNHLNPKWLTIGLYSVCCLFCYCGEIFCRKQITGLKWLNTTICLACRRICVLNTISGYCAPLLALRRGRERSAPAINISSSHLVILLRLIVHLWTSPFFSSVAGWLRYTGPHRPDIYFDMPS